MQSKYCIIIYKLKIMFKGYWNGMECDIEVVNYTVNDVTVGTSWAEPFNNETRQGLLIRPDIETVDFFET